MSCLPCQSANLSCLVDQLSAFVHRLERVEQLLHVFSAQLEAFLHEEDCLDEDGQPFQPQDGWPGEESEEGNS